MTDDIPTPTTLTREDALTLECDDTDSEFALSAEPDEPDTENELDEEDEADDYWPTDEQVAAWENEAAEWRNPDAYWTGYAQYDPSGEI